MDILASVLLSANMEIFSGLSNEGFFLPKVLMIIAKQYKHQKRYV